MKYVKLNELKLMGENTELHKTGPILVNLERAHWIKRSSTKFGDYTRICFGHHETGLLEVVDVVEAPESFLIGCVG